MNKILSYRGLLANDGQDTILLSTIKGEKGYRITKFELMPQNPMTADFENVVKVYSTSQSSITEEIDFSDNRLIAAGFAEGQPATAYTTQSIIVFGNMTFNQDIFITNKSEQGLAVNYYLELEVIMLNETEATVATLKDIRNNQ